MGSYPARVGGEEIVAGLGVFEAINAAQTIWEKVMELHPKKTSRGFARSPKMGKYRCRAEQGKS